MDFDMDEAAFQPNPVATGPANMQLPPLQQPVQQPVGPTPNLQQPAVTLESLYAYIRRLENQLNTPPSTQQSTFTTVPETGPKVPVNKPPVLKERMKNEDVDNWISQITNWIGLQETFVFRRPMAENEKVRLVSSYLEGDPFDCWQEGIATKSFAQQLDEISKRYTDLDWMNMKKQRFDSMKQKGSTRVFARELQTLSRKIVPAPPNEYILRRFRDGLRMEVRNALDTQLVMPDNTEPRQYVLRAIAYDDVLFRNRRNEEQLNAMPLEQLNAMSEKKKGKGKGKGKDKGKGKRDASKVTCYGCNKVGHYKNDCPSKK